MDFDLSWHKGAMDLSVVHGARSQGYAAPEQTATALKEGVSTRHTAVDVFGYGMLAYFILVETDPRPNEQNFKDFEQKITESIQRKFQYKWKCLSSYLSETIKKCTHDDQKDRISLKTAIERFRAAHLMSMSDQIESSNPLLLKEIATTIDPYCQIETEDFDRNVLVRCSDPSKSIRLILTNENDVIIVKIQLSKLRSMGEHRNVAKYLENAKAKALSKVKFDAFKKIKGEIGQSRLDIYLDWPLETFVLRNDIENVCEKLTDARLAMELN